MSVYKLLLVLHIVAGVLALITFWVAGLSRKGSPLHKGAGRVYLQSMLAVLGTALPMAGFHFAAGRVGIGTFLAYLVVITGTAMWLSWRAIQLKRAPAAYFNRPYLVVAVLNIVSGLGVFAIGVERGQALLMGFSWVGVIIGIGMLRKYRAAHLALPTGNWWLREHYSAMLGNGVATHIAFLGIGMRPILQAFDSPIVMLLPWFLPLIVSGIAGFWLDRRYARPQARAATPSTSASATLGT
jgi:hypothetical protein